MKARINRKKYFGQYCLSLAALLLVAPPSAAAPAPAVATTAIAKIDGESDKSLSIVTVALTGKPDWQNPTVEDHGTFVQVLLPNTVVPTPGTFLDANSPYITKIAAFQVSNALSGQTTDAAIRLFVNRDAAAVKQALVSEILADRVVVTLDHKKLEMVLTSTNHISTPAASESKMDAESTPTPADLVRAESIQDKDPATDQAGSWSGVGVKVPDLSNKLAIASGFSLFMLAILGIVYKWRRINPFSQMTSTTTSKSSRFKNIIKHRVPESENGDDFVRDVSKLTMKTISSMAVGPRQRLTLVQVGNETVLLSISPTGVQFLTTVGSGQRTSQPEMAQANQSAAPRNMQRLAESNSRSFEERLEPEDLEEVHAPKSQLSAEAPRAQSVRAPLKVNPRQGATITKKVRVAVTDNGITTLDTTDTTASIASKPSDDITRLIREKLRNLPVI